MTLVRNSLYVMLGAAIPLCVALVTIPLYLQIIGAERYGALAICWLLLGYFGQADFGMGRALTQRIAKMEDQPAAHKARTVVSAACGVLGFGVAASLILYLFGYWFFADSFKADEQIVSELLGALWMLAASAMLVSLSGITHGALMGISRFKLLSASNVVSNSGMQIVPLLTAYFFSIDLAYLIAASLAARLLGVLIQGLGVWHYLLRGQHWRVSKGEIMDMLSYGKWIMVTTIIGPLMVYLDRFAIGATLGAIAVAAYTIPYQLANRTLLLPQAFAQVAFPHFSALPGKESAENSQQYTAIIGLLFAPVILGLIGMAEPLMQLWLGDRLDPRSVLVARIILAGCWINGVAGIPFAFLQARNNPRFVALLHLAELPAYLVLLFFLANWLGLAGVAIAFALRCLIDGAALIVRAGRFAETGARLLLPAAAIVIAVTLDPILQGWTYSLVISAVLVGASSLLAWSKLPDDIRERMITQIQRLLGLQTPAD